MEYHPPMEHCRNPHLRGSYALLIYRTGSDLFAHAGPQDEVDEQFRRLGTAEKIYYGLRAEFADAVAEEVDRLREGHDGSLLRTTKSVRAQLDDLVQSEQAVDIPTRSRANVVPID